VIVLAVETSTARSSVALLVDGATVAHEHHEDARGHGAFLAPAMRRCLAAAPHDGGVARVDIVAVGTGPGLYTGLRVGMATASAFAAGCGVPIVGIGGMDALAHAHPVATGHLVTTLDARRGQVFWAVHAPGPGGTRCVDGPQVGTRAELDAVIAALAAGGPVLVAGEVGAATLARPDAVSTAVLASARHADAPPAGTPAPPLTPVYLRDADVRIGWDERGGMRGGVVPDGVARDDGGAA
jgi:tRNA threonylcarbamoyladenosine biosynthesis protein TsaB